MVYVDTNWGDVGRFVIVAGVATGIIIKEELDFIGIVVYKILLMNGVNLNKIPRTQISFYYP